MSTSGFPASRLLNIADYFGVDSEGQVSEMWSQSLRNSLHRTPQRLRTANLVAIRGTLHGSQKPAADAVVDFGELGLRYVPTKNPTLVVNKSFWTPPPSAEEKPVHEDIPFAVDRTSPGRGLPVYTDYKGGGTKVVTIVRKCRGDMKVMKEEMEKVCGRPVSIGLGKLTVDGNFHGRLKLWLTGLGF